MNTDYSVVEHSQIRTEDIKLFESAAKKLAKTISDILRYCPSANLYNTPGKLFLMGGPTHEDRGGNSPLYENVVTEVSIPTLSGGDW